MTRTTSGRMLGFVWQKSDNPIVVAESTQKENFQIVQVKNGIALLLKWQPIQKASK